MVESGGNGNPPKKSDPKEEKVRATRERQAEERLRRLEELKKHALEAQHHREQKEAERRRRMDELRHKESERRAQVETRKKEIWEADRERRESILRKNQDRDARMDAKRRNERSSIVFAFGSSTPRLLETVDSAACSYWGPRRATSTANLRLFPATPAVTETTTDGTTGTTPRRPSEREQEPKKRAVSAGGLYRSPSDQMSTSMYGVFHWEHASIEPTPLANAADMDDNWNVPRVGRRKTDLVPTTPSPRDPTSRPGSGTRSLARTPGDVTPSRPGSVMSQSTIFSSSISRPRTTPRKPRPSSIHVTGVSKDKIQSPSDEHPKVKEFEKRVNKPPAPRPLVTKKQIQQKNEEIKKSQSKVSEDNKKTVENSNVVKSDRKQVVKKDGTEENAEEHTETLATDNNILSTEKQEIEPEVKNKGATPSKESSELIEITEKKMEESNGELLDPAEGDDSGVSLLVDFSRPTPSLVPPLIPIDLAPSETIPQALPNQVLNPVPVPAAETVLPVEPLILSISPAQVIVDTSNSSAVDQDTGSSSQAPILDASSEVTSQVSGAEGEFAIKASRPTTAEEAKAKLAERRRLAREQAEREAEAERQRLAWEAEQEAERLRKEEEEQRKAEEEQLRLIEEARRLEEQRLMQAIQEAQKREEEEKEKKRLEEQARLEKEEADKQAREEAERQRVEMAERLKKEEEERQARRKRVEAIMKRTRNAPPNNSTGKAECEKGEQDRSEREKDDSKGGLEAFLHGERLSADRSLTNGQVNPLENLTSKMESGHSNGITQSGLPNEDCVNSNSSLATPLIAFQGSKDTPLPTDFMA